MDFHIPTKKACLGPKKPAAATVSKPKEDKPYESDLTQFDGLDEDDESKVCKTYGIKHSTQLSLRAH